VKIKKSYRFDDATHSGSIDEPNQCPMCKAKIKPVEISEYPYKSNDSKCFVAITYLCQSCYQVFIVLYSVSLYSEKVSSISTKYTFKSNLLYCEPNRFTEKSFEEAISTISPRFAKIYNQALEAESRSLDEIAGMGYRKALEFLIKDYLISLEPDNQSTIEGMELGNCIANKVSNDNVKTVASRCAWLGNDHSHYIVRHSDKDLNDLKNLLEATRYWIMMEAITRDSVDIEKK